MMRAFLPLVLLVGAFAGSIPAAAQPALRTASGHLDLSGVWSNASLTWLERPATLKGPTLSEAEAKARAAADPMKMAAARDARPSDPMPARHPQARAHWVRRIAPFTSMPATPSPGSAASIARPGSLSRATVASR